MAEDPKFSVAQAENPKTIIIDYGGPNVAKPLHVGHLRSAIIGESIKRIGRFVGHKVIGDVHLGDWGLQMGLIITELKLWGCSSIVCAVAENQKIMELRLEAAGKKSILNNIYVGQIEKIAQNIQAALGTDLPDICPLFRRNR